LIEDFLRRKLVKQTINVKAHPNSNDSTTIVNSGDDFRNDANITSFATTSNAQSFAAAVERINTNHRVKHHIEWRSIPAADLFKHTFVDKFLS
jgi:hypothetical protein